MGDHIRARGFELRRNRMWGRLFGATAAIAAALLIAGTFSVPGALAAPGDLDATVEWVDIAGVGVEDLTASTDSRSDVDLAIVGLRIAYSCGPVTCANTVVHLDPMTLDPFYNSERFAAYNSATLPGGATMSGNANIGWDVVLGDLAPGSGGSFTMLFNYQSRPVGVSPQSFFPEGAQAAATVAVSATGIEAVSHTDTVTWHIATPEPRVGFTVNNADTPLAVARADQEYSYTLYMSASCQWERSTAGHGEPTYECAESYTATHTLPAGAQFVSTSNGGEFDANTNTVTWTADGKAAAPGWGQLGGLGTPRTVTVVFPSSLFTDDCVLTAETTLTVDMTYLSGTQKTAAVTRTNEATACEPFAELAFTKDTTRNGGTSLEPIVWDGRNNYWSVAINNRSNVPAVSTVTDTFDQEGLDVDRVWMSDGAAQMLLTLDDGQVVDVTVQDYRAPSGRHITNATVITPALDGPNKDSSDTSLVKSQHVRFYYTPGPGVPTQGFTRTNTAQVGATFPGTEELSDLDLGTDSQSVIVTPRPPTIVPTLSASVVGGGNPVPGQIVNYTMHGVTRDMGEDVPFEPQYVFVAPPGWEIIADSAVVSGVPDAVLEYKSVQIAGETRQAVYAHRPDGTVWGVNTTTADMTVQATPAASVPANTEGTATFYLGDAAHNYSRTSAIWGQSRIDDSPDLDGDGVTTEPFTFASVKLRVGSASGVSVLKEICEPDPTQPDGCNWLSNPDVPVAVAPNTADIGYRVTITNAGTTPLTNIVGYDVLPYPGDTAVTPGGAPRGSTFTEKVASVSSATAVQLAFSGSTNPCRPQVNATTVDCVDDWAGSAAGKQSIRAMVPGTLAGGASVSFTYVASVEGNPSSGALACNSVAVVSASTPVTEPRAVCATVVEANLEATGPDTVGAQQGRPTELPFTFENLGGANESPATVTIAIPVGVSVTNLEPDGWTCTATTPAPVVGPADIECAPPGTLVVGTPAVLGLDTVITVPEATVTATVTGPLFDTDTGNNSHSIRLELTAAAGGLLVSKSDGVDSVRSGDETEYTVTVGNPLEFEELGAVTVADTLPSGVEFVSASAGGTYLDNAVSWNLPGIAAAGSVDLTVRVRVLDSAATQITNSVTASAVDPAFSGDTLDGSATDTDTVDRITLTKTGSISGTAAPRAGDAITYTFIATNSGGGVLSDVTIGDPLVGLSEISIDTWPTVPGRLGAGESVAGTATYSLTQADIDSGVIVNSADASGTTNASVPVTAQATHTQVLTEAASVTLTKSVTGVEPVAGGTVTFGLSVTNTGNVTVRDVAILDDLAGISELAYTWPSVVGVLAPGETATATATYVVSQAEVDAGSLLNAATVSALSPTDVEVGSEDTATAIFVQNPVLTLEKNGAVADPETVASGDEIEYTFTVQNAGNVTVSAISLTDELSGLSDVSFGEWPGEPGVLLPGESVEATATYVVTQGDMDAGHVDNDATVVGTAPGGQPTASDAVTVGLAGARELELTKTAVLDSNGAPVVGDTITYGFTVENTGTVTVAGVEIADELTGLGDIEYGDWPGSDGKLEPGQIVGATAMYVLTQADIDAGTVTNSAEASATAGGVDVSAIDTVTVALAADPGIEIAKTASVPDGILQAGDTIGFDFVVENIGNVTLAGVEIADELAGLSPVELGDWPLDDGALAPGERVIATAEYTLTQADLDAGTVVNSATASANGVRGGSAIDTDTATAELTAAAALTLSKAASLETVDNPRAGDSIAYSFVVKNAGNVTVDDIRLADLMPGLTGITFGDWPAVEGVLAPNESVTATAAYVLTQADLDSGSVANSADVSGTPARGDDVNSNDEVTIELAAIPALEFTKVVELADPERPVKGQEARFGFTLENTGNITLTDVSIEDEFDGLSEITMEWLGEAGTLAPGESADGAATYALVQADIDRGSLTNDALAHGDPVRGDTIETPAQATVDLVAAPGLELVKSASLDDLNGDGYANTGESLEYAFTVTNTGNVTAGSLVVDDPMLDGIPGVSTLAPGESIRVVAPRYTVTQADAEHGTIPNTATVTGEHTNGAAVTSNESTVVVDALVISRPDSPAGSLPGTGANPLGVLMLALVLFGLGAAATASIVVRRREQDAPR